MTNLSPRMRLWLEGVEREKAEKRRAAEEERRQQLQNLDRLLRGDDEEEAQPSPTHRSTSLHRHPAQEASVRSSANAGDVLVALEERIEELMDGRGLSLDDATQQAESELKKRADKREGIKLEEQRQELERLLEEGD